MRSGSHTQLALAFPQFPFSFDNATMSGEDSDNESDKGFTRTRKSAFASRGSALDAKKRGTFDRGVNAARGSTEALRDKQSALDLPESNDIRKARVAIDPAQKLRNKALRLLTTREHSREELLRKLEQAKARHAKRAEQVHDRHAAKDEIEKLIDDLAAQGWQSDERYAEAMVRRLTGQASKRYIVEKLAQAGIKKEVAQLALEALDQDDYEIAKSLWLRRYSETPRDDKERQRQIRFLLARGFHLSDAFKIIPRPKRSINSED